MFSEEPELCSRIGRSSVTLPKILLLVVRKMELNEGTWFAFYFSGKKKKSCSPHLSGFIPMSPAPGWRVEAAELRQSSGQAGLCGGTGRGAAVSDQRAR